MNEKKEPTKDIGTLIDSNMNINLIKTLVWFRVLLFECTILAKIIGGKPLRYIPMLLKREYLNREEILDMFTFKGIPEKKMKLTEIFALSSMGVDRYVKGRLEEFETLHIKSPTLKSFLKDIENRREYLEDMFFSGVDRELFDYMRKSLTDWDEVEVKDETPESSKEFQK